MVKFLNSHTPYINELVFNTLINSAQSVNFNKSGSNSNCAIIDNYAVLSTGNIPQYDDSFDRLIEELHTLKENGVNVVPILGYGITEFGTTYSNGERYDDGYIVQEKAKGQELFYPSVLKNKSIEEQNEIIMKYINMLSSIPQEHYDKWVSDYKTISDKKIMIDPSKESNFFYDKDNGFSFIDLNFFTKEKLFDKPSDDGECHHAEFILYTMAPFKRLLSNYYLQSIISSKDIEMIERVVKESFEKLCQALAKLGVTKEDIDYTISKFNIPTDKILSLNATDEHGSM